MSLHFSVRDVSFHSSTTGVRIIVTTDVPCHLWCRLSENEPQIHKRPVFRRGMWLNDDVRFCFTAYEDNEQFEAGDTITHTFWKTNWPVCTTKYMYFFASIGGQWCVSTSPIFEYHNDGKDPVYPPRMLDVFTSLEPERQSPTASYVWQTVDVSKLVDENATALIIQIVNRRASGDSVVGVRKPGDTVTIPAPMHQSSQCWAVAGLDSSLQFEIYSSHHSLTDFFIMGYTNSRFVMLDQSINIWEGFHDVWRSYNITDIATNAVAAIIDLAYTGAGEPWWGLRCGGSTDVRTQSSERSWCIVPCDDSGNIESYIGSWPASNPRLQLTGYITGTIVRHINAQSIPLGIGTSWQYASLKSLATMPVLVVVEYDCANPNLAGGVQKGYSRIVDAPYLQRKCWAFPHPAPNGIGNFMRVSGVQSYWRSIEFDSDL